jgi:hypothetical protein
LRFQRTIQRFILVRIGTHSAFTHSAANDFWGKTFRNLTGSDKMTQNLSILTGCFAGATESVVVVPFELVKIKYVI